MEKATISKENLLKNREALEDLLKRRFYIMQSFGIYGGKAGLFDYGPPGCAIKANVEQLWREHFILEDDILEIACTNVTPEEVLKTSGHVDKFADIMVKDTKDPQFYYRADHLIEETIENLLKKEGDKMNVEKKAALQEILKNLPNYKIADIKTVIESLGIKSPKTGNPLSDPYEFNLMFGIQIGPTGDQKGYLRPETAQGMFVNFKNLLDYNGGRMPFGCAQIGIGFRNEIAPRAGLLRVREFTLAEIEYFVDPQDKNHPKFKNYRNQVLTFYDRKAQVGDGKTFEMTIGEAVDKKIVGNEALAYFMVRTHIFLLKVGCKNEGIRFRQHREDEMAHYSSECWDAEVLTSYGWVELVGIADRSAYDLTRHTEVTKKDLVAARKFTQPKLIKFIDLKLNKQLIGKTFKQDNKLVVETLETLGEECKAQMKASFEKGEKYLLSIKDKQFEITPEMATLEAKEKNVMEEKYVPNVIEPAFGLGRIIYAAWEHNFVMRSKERTFIALPPKIAPYKCSILTVVTNEEFEKVVDLLVKDFKLAGISHKVDISGQSIGKRYARTDEVGIPFGITIDHQTLTDKTVTLREIITLQQVRIPLADVAKVVHDLSEDLIKWSDVTSKYPAFTSNADE